MGGLHGATVHVADITKNGCRRRRGQEVARIAGRGSCGGSGAERATQAAGAAAEAGGSSGGTVLLHAKVLLQRGLMTQLLQSQLILSLPLGAATREDKERERERESSLERG